jgi:integrase/recombinase XerD
LAGIGLGRASACSELISTRAISMASADRRQANLGFSKPRRLPMSEPSDIERSIERLQTHMRLRGLRPNTMRTFAGCASRFLTHVGKPPAEVTTTDVEAFLLELVHRGRSALTRTVYLSALRCLLAATLGDAGRSITATIPRARRRRRCPEILSGSEVARLLDATDSPKYRAIFMLAYGAGLRVSEITALRACDIDSERMLIHVPEGKTGPRHVMLSPRVLLALRTYWKVARPKGPELFPGGRAQRPGTRLSRKSINKVLATVGRKAGITKRVHPHLLRHCFATHMLEVGADVRSVQVLLGHACLESTTTYLHLSRAHLRATPSPIDLLGTRAGSVLG